MQPQKVPQANNNLNPVSFEYQSNPQHGRIPIFQHPVWVLPSQQPSNLPPNFSKFTRIQADNYGGPPMYPPSQVAANMPKPIEAPSNRIFSNTTNSTKSSSQSKIAQPTLQKKRSQSQQGSEPKKQDYFQEYKNGYSRSFKHKKAYENQYQVLKP